MVSLRPYQSRVVTSIGRQNAIVKMPTGSGKTIVGAELIRRQMDRDPSLAALFLVPMRDLVEQQAGVIEAWCDGTKVFQYCGGLADPDKERAAGKVCIVSTPKAFTNLQRRKPGIFGWSEFGIVIFDEVHHLLKEHPYRHIALDLREMNIGPRKAQIVALSASLTYGVEEAAIRATLDRLCQELKVDIMESPSIDELVSGGYSPQYGHNVELERSSEVPEGVLERSARKPHLMHDTFMKRVQKKTATSFSLRVWRIVNALETKANSVCSSFVSPLQQKKLISWEEYAHDKHKQCQGDSAALFHELCVWYTALRLLVQTWEEEEVLVMQWLKLNNALEGVDRCEDSVEIQQAFENPFSFFKLGRLRYHLIKKHEKRGENFRCIVFVQQRIAAFILSKFIQTDEELRSLGLRAGFATREGEMTPAIKMTKGMKNDAIAAFRNNDLNIIVTTSLLEEGFDVPDANVVICYDYMKDSVELCQRSGRARQLDSSIVILDERPDRPLSVLETARDLQDQVVEQYDPSSIPSIDEEKERLRQQNRERTAFKSVFGNKKGGDIYASPLLSLHEFVAKTKASFSEAYTGCQNDGFVCTLTYRTNVRTMQVEGQGARKKTAKIESAISLLAALETEAIMAIS